MSKIEAECSTATDCSQVSVGEIEIMEAEISAIMGSESMRRREWLEQWFGPRCPDYVASCINCKVWRNQDQFEKMTNL